jgi:hypothetical protein
MPRLPTVLATSQGGVEVEHIHSDGCHKPALPAGQNGDVDGNGDVVDERLELMTWLTARLRFWIVASWLDDDGTPAVSS